MKLLVKTVASTAVVLVTLAGCASRSSGGSSSAAAGSGSNTTSSAPASGSTSTENGSQPPAPGTTGTTASSGNSGGQQSAPGSQGSQSSQSSPAKPDPSAEVKYISPQGVTLASDGITLVAEVAWGGCSDQPQLVIMSQDASKVVVELKTTSHARIGVMCPDIARTGEASAKLAAPLGSRQVIDGIKNAPINVR